MYNTQCVAIIRHLFILYNHITLFNRYFTFLLFLCVNEGWKEVPDKKVNRHLQVAHEQ